MQSASSPASKRVRFPGVSALTETGRRAMIDLQDEPPAVATFSGDATGAIENINVVTDDLGTGHVFDVVCIPGPTTGALTELDVNIDADNDAGEVRTITERINYTVTADEAASISFPAPVLEDNV